MTTSNNIKKLTLSVSEAAKLLGISRNAAYLAVHRGEIPSVIVGRRILVPVSALERMLADAGSSQSETTEPR